MRKFYLKFLVIVFAFCTKSIVAQAITENFDDITTLVGSGWVMQNNSSPVGSISWFQGTPTTATPTPGPFNAYNGAANAYIGANFNSTGSTGTISNWLLTPNRTLRNGDVFTFYTRKPTIGAGQTDYPDRLEVRLSTNGASTNVGTGASALGDFTTLLLSINPTLVANVYPQVWTQYTITISGLPAPTSGRLAFRYFVTGAGSLGTNSDYIGIDAFTYTPYVCPSFTMTPSGALTGGTAGSAYSKALSQTGALGTPSYAVTAGALPPGLTLSSSGTISGTPTATGTFNFTATVSDASGCSGSASYSITVTCAANPITINTFPTLCNNSGLYTLTEASPTGGTYSGTGVTAGQFDPSAGTQTITYDYIDPYGCAHSATKTITVNTAPTVILTSNGGVLANGYTGSVYNATFGQTGATGTPSFEISSGALPAGTSLSASGVLSGTPTTAGSFTFTVKVNSSNGCFGYKNFTIIIQAGLSIAPGAQTNVACNGSATGSATVSATGGLAPYTYSWNTTPVQTNAIATNLAAGTYEVTVKDANNVSKTLNFTITEPTALASSITAQTNVACNGSATGSATVAATGGTGSYTYSWNTTPAQTTATATGLAAGSYIVTIKDANQCQTTKTVNITEAPAIAAPTGVSTQSFNAGDNLGVLVVVGQNIKWYATAENATNHVNNLPLNTLIVNDTTYYATQTISGCESRTSLAVKAFNITLGLNNVNGNIKLQLYPNPVKDILYFSGQDKISKVMIASIDGKKITEKLMNEERKLNVHSLIKGVYLIQIFTDKGIQTIKFIKD